MRTRIELVQSDDGEPLARVPGDIAWNLIEYLSNQRVHAKYSFEESRVVVRFDHINMSAVEQLLDMWMRAEQRDKAFYAPSAEGMHQARTHAHA